MSVAQTDGCVGPQTDDRTLEIQRCFDVPLTGGADERARSIVDYLMTVRE